MNIDESINSLISTPKKREVLLNKSDSEKLQLVMELTDSKNIIDLLDFIDGANEDKRYCDSYR